jgi:hypothetical protein
MKSMEPRLRSFIHPATSLGVRTPTLFPHLVAARLDVPSIVATLQSASEVGGVVRFVGAQMLRSPRDWLRTMDRHAVERRHRQLEVVAVRRSDRQPQHDAANIGEHRPLHAQLAAIGRIWPGFFPLPAELSSLSCRASAIASRCLCDDHIRPNPVSTTCETLHACTTLESNDADCCRSRTLLTRPSMGSRSASQSRCHQRHVAGRAADAHLSGTPAVLATTCSTVAKAPLATFDKNLQ